MENYSNPSIQTGFDAESPHFHIHGMAFPTNVLLDDVCVTSADNGCFPLINSYDESIVDNLICSQSQLGFYNCSQIRSALQEETEPYDNCFRRNESKETLTFPPVHDEIMGAFKKWNSSQYLKSLSSKRGQSIQKRCIRLLKYIRNHRILSPDSDSRNDSMRGDVEINVRHNHDKLAIHHVIVERKRREDMGELFSTLRGLLPAKTKKGRATVLLQTIDYVMYLKARVEELEKRNLELERLTLGDHTSQNVSNLSGEENNCML